jgi:hypothetical protein
MQGQLFTHDFLTRGILDTDPWRACGDAALCLHCRTARGYGSLAADSTLNEGKPRTSQKLQGQTINLFILEQLPVIARAAFEQCIGKTKIADYIRAEVLALTYTAHDMAPLARDLGYVDGNGKVKPPFVWDLEDRRQRMACLDALFMHLYGLGEADADYILSTFPIVCEKDEAAFGTYRTRDSILAYLQRIGKGLLSHAGM